MKKAAMYHAGLPASSSVTEKDQGARYSTTTENSIYSMAITTITHEINFTAKHENYVPGIGRDVAIHDEPPQTGNYHPIEVIFKTLL